MNWKQNALAVAAFAMLALPGYAQPTGSPPPGSATSGTTTSPQTTAPEGKATGQYAPAPNQDAMLLGFIHHANLSEIQAGNLAKSNSNSSQVKDFGERIVRDHQSADDQVTALAKSRNIDFTAMHGMKDQPSGTLKDDPQAAGHKQAMAEHKAALDKLSTVKGADFDREFTGLMVKDHQMLIDKLTAARSRVSDPAVSGLVDKLLPTLKQHLAIAQKLQDTVSKT
jgi:putative membrane protein